jgi:hypothetical protein
MFDYSDEEDEQNVTVASGPSQGQEYPVRHNDMVQANAGYGSTQYNAASYPMAPLGGSPDGIGAYSRLYQMPTPGATRSGVLGSFFTGSPLINGIRAVSGLGDDAATTANANALPGAAVEAASGILVAAVAVGLVLTGVGSYYVGKAVAPSRDKESTYAGWGVVAGLLGGPIALGVESMIALNHKGR